MSYPIRDKTAIAGIGWTRFSNKSDTTVLNLAAEASLNAINDAGLRPSDIDGVITFFWTPDTVTPHQVVETLGIKECNFEIHSQLGGGWPCGAVAAAAMAVFSGVCKNVLVYRAMNGRSGFRTNQRKRPATGPHQFSIPYGVAHAAANFGHYATAHMARYGTTTQDFAHLAVTQRRHALLNKKAAMSSPLTIEQHQNSRWIVYPLRLFDCCLETDGAVALVVTTLERARDLPHAPISIMAMLGGAAPPPHPWATNGLVAAPKLYADAGIVPKDVSFAELYDPFTSMCMLHMEDFGLVPKGEVGAWVREGLNGLDGAVPVNTHGGLLSEGYIQGLNHVIEAVQQLRPGGVVDDHCVGGHTFDRATCRQVRNPEIALVCGEAGGSSILLRRA
jgi:acetyl-CoA acetyltransferase